MIPTLYTSYYSRVQQDREGCEQWFVWIQKVAMHLILPTKKFLNKWQSIRHHVLQNPAVIHSRSRMLQEILSWQLLSSNVTKDLIFLCYFFFLLKSSIFQITNTIHLHEKKCLGIMWIIIIIKQQKPIFLVQPLLFPKQSKTKQKLIIKLWVGENLLHLAKGKHLPKVQFLMVSL